MADSCNKYLIMLMKIVLKTSTTHSAVPHAAVGLITPQHSQGIFHSLSRCLPGFHQGLPNVCTHCALPSSNKGLFIFENTPRITHWSTTKGGFFKPQIPHAAVSEVTQGLTLWCLYLLISFCLCSQMPMH